MGCFFFPPHKSPFYDEKNYDFLFAISPSAFSCREQNRGVISSQMEASMA
jgi:hypothetical protein